MRIVHLDEMFHPDFGYQINVLTKYNVLQGHETIIVTTDEGFIHPMFRGFGDNSNIKEKDKLFEKRTGVKIIRVPVRGVVSGRVCFENSYKKVLDDLKPDILFCHFVETIVGMQTVLRSKKLNYPVIFDSHMLEMASKNRFRKFYNKIYKCLITPFIKKNNLTIIRTQDDEYINRCLGIPLEQAPFISFGTDTELFKPDKNLRSEFRKEHNISEDDFVVVYTGKLNKEKGGMILAEAFLEKFDNNKNKNVVLVVVGNTEGDYGNKVENKFNESKNRVLRFETQKYLDLAKFYQAADLSVFAKQCSLSFYDAQACGIPVISEDNNVNVDRLQYGNGLNFKSEDIEDFRKKITDFINLEEEVIREMKINSIKFIEKKYDYWKIANEYTMLMEREVKRKGKENK